MSPNPHAPPFTLASGSPFRRKMLEDAGLHVPWASPDVDERALEADIRAAGGGPEAITQGLAAAKARAVLKMHPQRPALGADQVLALDGEIIGKPHSPEEARGRIASLAGRTHALMTGGCLAFPDGRERPFLEVTRLTFRALTPEEVSAYVETGEWQGCAGGYRIEGQGIQLVEAIDGDFFNIVGLPLLRVLSLVREEGLL